MTFSTSTVVGAELAAVIPTSRKPWYSTPHLAKLSPRHQILGQGFLPLQYSVLGKLAWNRLRAGV
jgi:hypothetical protein